MLNDFYGSQVYPSPEDMASLANETGIPYKTVKTWFAQCLFIARTLSCSYSRSSGFAIGDSGRGREKEQAQPKPTIRWVPNKRY